MSTFVALFSSVVSMDENTSLLPDLVNTRRAGMKDQLHSAAELADGKAFQVLGRPVTEVALMFSLKRQGQVGNNIAVQLPI